MNYTTQCGENRHTDVANFATLIHKKKLIHCVSIFTILYGNYYPPHGKFKLICIGKFARRTWMNFSQQYGKNRQRCRKKNFTLLYGNYYYIIIDNFPQKLSPCSLFWLKLSTLGLFSCIACVIGYLWAAL